MTDLELAVRTLLRAPFITAVAVVSLAVGIGANAALFLPLDQMSAGISVVEPSSQTKGGSRHAEVRH